MTELARSTSHEPAEGPAADAAPLRVAFPRPQARSEQDHEWCVARVNGEWREIRFHDYGRVYEIPGLYEHIFRDLLKCRSPRVVRNLLGEEIQSSCPDAPPLRVLDLGAGNGLMAEELAELGVELVVGADIIPEAAQAAERDRPETYEEYFVIDMTRVTEDERRAMSSHGFNCLTCVAALGFGDIPPQAFAEAYNLIAPGGWIAFNIKEQFLGNGDRSGFARLIVHMASEGVLSIRRRQRYPHRLAVNGEPIYYVAVVGRKVRDIELPLSCPRD
jgi:2-polyprenyl-3-methyl-5-hydroxy-6-metoxy-1,4-benzoquinol methylase